MKKDRMENEKIYYGAFSRYHVRMKTDTFPPWNTIFIPADEWKDNIGSYKLVDKGDCYDSFEIHPDGRETPMSVDKPFSREELETEIKIGALVSPFKLWLIRILRLPKWRIKQ